MSGEGKGTFTTLSQILGWKVRIYSAVFNSNGALWIGSCVERPGEPAR